MQKTGILILFIFTILVLNDLGYSQPQIPIDKVPTSIRRDIRTQIYKLYSKDAVERGTAAYKLGNMGYYVPTNDLVPAVPFLIEILKDDTPLKWGLRRFDTSPCTYNCTSPGAEAARSLGFIQDSRAVEPLIAILKNKNDSSRKRFNSVVALGIIRNPNAVDALIVALKDEDYSVKANAIGALEHIEDSRAVEPLIALLKDNKKTTVQLAVSALKKITKQDFGENIIKWREWWEKKKVK